MFKKCILYTLLLTAAIAVTVKADSDYEYSDYDEYNDYDQLKNDDEDSDEIMQITKFSPKSPPKTSGLLYPFESETRDVRLLDGIWNFVKSDKNDPLLGVEERWYENDLIKSQPITLMPVPASYNDLSTDKQMRDHSGTVWYERKIFIPKAWALNQRIWLRFGSVHYSATVWLNGKKVTKHDIGHLPFEAEITSFVKYGAENRLTVMCDNTLTKNTVPQGNVNRGFFNYAGIHRSVHLYTTPNVFIEYLTVTTNLTSDKTGFIDYKVTPYKANNKKLKENEKPSYVIVKLLNREGDYLQSSRSTVEFKGTLKVPNAKPWWPYLMHPEPGYLYTLVIELHAKDKTLLDVYRLKVGIRTLKWTNTSVLLNDKELYLRGFGRHEDADIRGRGLDLALLTRDFNLIKWVGANSYRTSHYPYSEESMQFADEHGIMIIDECPSIGAKGFSSKFQLNHKSSLEQLIHRDRNHPSVIMWSIENNPSKNSSEYLINIADYTRSLDPTRPITASLTAFHNKDGFPKKLDVVSFNKYLGWSDGPGRLHKIHQGVLKRAHKYKKYNKPVIMSEYGGDSLESLHILPEYIWSEEYQTALFSEHFKAFDDLRKQKWFIGEFVWNFADFKTPQSYVLVGGSKKGIFTRNRQPKAAAYLLRQRYHGLGHLLDGSELPEDLDLYIAETEHERSKRDLAEL